MAYQYHLEELGIGQVTTVPLGQTSPRIALRRARIAAKKYERLYGAKFQVTLLQGILAIKRTA